MQLTVARLKDMSATATPAMRQYLDAKQQHRDAILFFRMGDFYEMFYEDALVAARALELTLTSRSKDANGGGIPMCGVPFHAVDGYIARLVKKGFRVAICDQVEDPRKAKGLVKREVVRVVSPGTLTDANYLDAREPAFLMAVRRRRRGRTTLGVALLDLSTGEFSRRRIQPAPTGCRRSPTSSSVLKPREIIVAAIRQRRDQRRCARDRAVGSADDARRRLDVRTWSRRDAHAARSAARRRPRRLRPRRPSGGGRGRRRAGALPARHAEGRSRARPRRSRYRQRADALLIDPTTLKHLEIVEGSEGGRDGSLLDELDRTVTSMGSRLLRAWLLRPLVALEPIRDRLDAVEELAFRTTERGKFRDALKAVQDLERLVARAALGTAGPRDLVGLKQSLDGRPARAHRARASCRRRSCARCWPQLDDLADVRDAHRTRRSSTIRRRWRATAASPATASTPSSTSCARSAARASRSSPRWKSASGRAPASPR